MLVELGMGHLKEQKKNSLKILKAWRHTPPPPPPPVLQLLTDPTILSVHTAQIYVTAVTAQLDKGLSCLAPRPWSSHLQGENPFFKISYHQVCMQEKRKSQGAFPSSCKSLCAFQVGNSPPAPPPPPTYSFSAFSFLKYGCLCTVDCQIQKWIHQRLAQCSMTLNTACLKYPIWNDTNLDWWEWLSTWGSMQQKIQPIKRTRPQVFLRGGHCNQPLTSPVFWAEDRALTSGDFLSLVPSSKKTDLPQPHLQGNPADNQLLILEVPGPGRERPEREVLL